MSSTFESVDINDLFQEAQSRWLKPPEVLFILQNYEKYQITNEPPQTPSNGSLFLFNKRTLRNFRKDGHNWRKKRDNRSIKEAHERLKVGSDEALNCYYAHGETNPNFQRRSFWMLDPAFKDIVLVHYRDVSEGISSSSIAVSSPSIAQQSPVSSSSSEVNQYLRKIEEQLSLNDESLEQLKTSYTLEERTDDSEFSQNRLVEDTWPLSDMLEGYNTSPAFNGYINDHFINTQDFVGEESEFDCMIDFRSDSLISSPPKFAIRDLVPNWGFSSDSTKIVIVGAFLCEPSGYAWKCKIGDYEVPVEVIQDGVLRCEAPPHRPGKVAIRITSNGESCSETKEFEYRYNSPQPEAPKSPEELLLLIRWVRMLLCEGEENNSTPNDETWDYIMGSVLVGSVTPDKATELIMYQLLKHQLTGWISSKRKETAEQDGCTLSRKDQGIIHNIAGLGFDWALRAVLECGISIDFRDIRGWTALHWAARFGREEMVAALVASGASALAVTDPDAAYPVGQNPASVADFYGHKGLAGYLSELALTSHLSSLQLSPATAEVRAVETTADGAPTDDQLYLKDTLAAVRNAAQAAARIQAAFRSYSFRKMKEAEAGNRARYVDEYGLRLSEAERKKIAAQSIQKRYRGWKGRRDFLTIKKKVVKLQAHVRGYQARKSYRVCWAVGVLEKAILRWRRKGAGLRGYRADSDVIDETEDEDILKLFRLQKVNKAIDEAVSRVLSLVESSEARQQYHRMLLRYWQAKAELGTAAGTAMAAPVVFEGSGGM